MAGRRWTAAEDAVLDEQFGILDTRVIARRLARTSPAVHQRALKRGLVDAMAGGDLSLTDVRQILGLADDYRLIYGWLREGLLVRRTRHGGRRSWIAEDDLVSFLRANEHLIDRAKVDPAYQQFVADRWITLVEAFRKGAAHVVSLEHACLAGTIPEARKRGVRWVIPESIVPRLREGRRRWTDDVEQHRQLQMYLRLQRRGKLHGNVGKTIRMRRRPAA